jgi:formyltetrahydrofolate deformylase
MDAMASVPSTSAAVRAAAPAVRRVLTLTCRDAVGIVHAVSGFLADRRANIVDSQQFSDTDADLFFMRLAVDVADPHEPVTLLVDAFAEVARRFAMRFEVMDPAQPKRLLVLVSRLDHCLYDLIYRCRTGTVPATIAAVVSNHPDTRELVESAGIAFHHLAVTPDTKADAEARMRELAAVYDVDVWILARYMQILSPQLCADLAGKAINIHHSFLPSFKGARPYHQAYARGVKLIGATAHYVTADLDEGPIIEQEVARVDHTMGPDTLVDVGRDLECQALARAVRWHVENRVVLNGHRTVVFR